MIGRTIGGYYFYTQTTIRYEFVRLLDCSGHRLSVKGKVSRRIAHSNKNFHERPPAQNVLYSDAKHGCVKTAVKGQLDVLSLVASWQRILVKHRLRLSWQPLSFHSFSFATQSAPGGGRAESRPIVLPPLAADRPKLFNKNNRPTAPRQFIRRCTTAALAAQDPS